MSIHSIARLQTVEVDYVASVLSAIPPEDLLNPDSAARIQQIIDNIRSSNTDTIEVSDLACCIESCCEQMSTAAATVNMHATLATKIQPKLVAAVTQKGCTETILQRARELGYEASDDVELLQKRCKFVVQALLNDDQVDEVEDEKTEVCILLDERLLSTPVDIGRVIDEIHEDDEDVYEPSPDQNMGANTVSTFDLDSTLSVDSTEYQRSEAAEYAYLNELEREDELKAWGNPKLTNDDGEDDWVGGPGVFNDEEEFDDEDDEDEDEDDEDFDEDDEDEKLGLLLFEEFFGGLDTQTIPLKTFIDWYAKLEPEDQWLVQNDGVVHYVARTAAANALHDFMQKDDALYRQIEELVDNLYGVNNDNKILDAIQEYLGKKADDLICLYNKPQDVVIEDDEDAEYEDDGTISQFYGVLRDVKVNVAAAIERVAQRFHNEPRVLYSFTRGLTSMADQFESEEFTLQDILQECGLDPNASKGLEDLIQLILELYKDEIITTIQGHNDYARIIIETTFVGYRRTDFGSALELRLNNAARVLADGLLGKKAQLFEAQMNSAIQTSTHNS